MWNDECGMMNASRGFLIPHSTFFIQHLLRSRLTDGNRQRDDDAADRRRHLLGEKHRGVNRQRDHDQPD